MQGRILLLFNDYIPQAKRHQTDIDATYGNISKELEVLADNFQLGKSNSDDGNGKFQGFNQIYGVPPEKSVLFELLLQNSCDTDFLRF